MRHEERLSLTRALEEANLERQALFAELGAVLYEKTKSDESFFLMAPGLYLAIARVEETRARCMHDLGELQAGERPA